MNRQRILFSLALIFPFLPVFISAQERIVGLENNPVIRKARKDNAVLRKSLQLNDTLELPFFDDFSRNSIFPSSALWEDQDVFVNFSYGINPPSIGVATLDAIDSTGFIYEHASYEPFEADHLTSLPINLEGAGNDVFLSFYYQTPGNVRQLGGDYPQVEDSLFLEFFTPLDTSWTVVWKIPGPGKDSLVPFKQIVLPVDQAEYLVKGFKFRFRNLASISDFKDSRGREMNCDFWNLDYVLLDKGRSLTDTVHHDVAVFSPIGTLIRNYESMPWKHFRKVYLSEMGSTIPLNYINQDNITRNVTRNFVIEDVYNNIVAHSYTGGALNIDPWDTIYYKSTLLYTFNSTRENTALFKITAYLITDDFDQKINDTVIFYQTFGDYFAYDDGTPEAGYGIDGAGAQRASVACQFKSEIPDSLLAVQIYFNQSFQNANDVYFNLVVWADNDGKPGEAIYREEALKPVFTDSLMEFYTYKLSETVPVDGVFYVGWEQTSETFLNVGFDIGGKSYKRLFYTINEFWNKSQFTGDLMIRPVISSGFVTGIPDTPEEVRFNVYPNPTSSELIISIGRNSFLSRIKIYNTFGKLIRIIDAPNDKINVSDLDDGLYIIEIQTSGKTGRKKFLKISN
jgi:hypothetical protein